MTTLEKPHSTEINVMADGRANLERRTTLRRLALRSSRFSLRLMFDALYA
jgi:hypothetical protein